MEAEDRFVPYHTTPITGMRALVLAPHPDDETIGCGGCLKLHVESAEPVKVVFLTNGALGDPTAQRERWQLIQDRRREAIEACRHLGVADLEFWPYEDRQLAATPNACDRLGLLLNAFQPKIIYCPSPMEIHPDHRAAADLLAESLMRTELQALVAFYEISHPVFVNCLVDITPVLHCKQDALAVYTSQLAVHPYDDYSLALNRYRALTLPAEVTHAEGLWRIEACEIRNNGLLAAFQTHLMRFRVGLGKMKDFCVDLPSVS